MNCYERIKIKIRNGEDVIEELNMGRDSPAFFERLIEESSYENVKICNQWSKIFTDDTKDKEIQKELDNAKAQLNEVEERTKKLIDFIFF